MLAFPNIKINLGLSITEKRPDGYHNLCLLYTSILKAWRSSPLVPEGWLTLTTDKSPKSARMKRPSLSYASIPIPYSTWSGSRLVSIATPLYPFFCAEYK